MAGPQEKEKFTEEVLKLQDQLSDGKLSQEDFKRKVEELKKKYDQGGGGSDKVKFKVKSDDKKPPEPSRKGDIKEAKVIEVPEKYERRSSYSIDDIKKKIDRLDSEGVHSLRDRYKERYGEELMVPDLHTENVREALEDVKQYLDIEEGSEEAKEKEEEKAEETEKEQKKEDEGPSFFARIIAAIKRFFASIFSRKSKNEAGESAGGNPVEEAVAVSNGE